LNSLVDELDEAFDAGAEVPVAAVAPGSEQAASPTSAVAASAAVAPVLRAKRAICFSLDFP
jgi:hypothetical protein